MVDSSTLRVGQQRCITVIREWFAGWREAYNKEPRRSVDNFVGCIPTRYGKTLIQLAAADEMLETLPYVVGISPAIHLRDNVGDQEKYHRYMDEHCLSGRAFPRALRALPRVNQQLDHHFLSLTTQTTHAQRGVLGQWIEAVIHRHGLPPAFMLDECHGFGESGEWRDIVKTLREYHCPILMFTATLIRGDGTAVHGVRYEEVESKEVEQTVCRPHEDPKKFYIDKELVRKGKYKATPTYEYLFRDAWDERPRVLPELERVPVPCFVKLISEDGEVGDEQALKDLPDSALSKALGNCVRSPRTIRACLDVAVKTLKARREQAPRSRMIVFASPRSKKHDTRIDNSHVRAIMSALKEVGNGLKAEALDAEDPSAAGRLRAFCDPESDSAPDIVVLKSMGSVGIDAPTCEVVCDLSPRRTYGDWVQRVMRAGTWSGFKTCMLVTPDDGRAEANWQLLTGQPAPTVALSDLLERISREEVEKDDRDSENEAYITTRVDTNLSFIDRAGNEGLADLALQIMERLPILAKEHSHAEVAEVAADLLRGSFMPKPQHKNAVTNAELGVIRTECGDLTRRVTTKRLAIARRNGEHIGEFGDVARDVDAAARKLAKRHLGVELPYFNDPNNPDYEYYSMEQFHALRQALTEMLKQRPFA